MNQLNLTMLTEFEQATANQLAVYCGREKPSDKDIQETIKLCVKWNKHRTSKNLKPWI